jgi:uncharacterized protein (DUF2062 family)
MKTIDPVSMSVTNVAIVAPTFNNAGTLPDLLQALDGLGLFVIVVNDGSADRTHEILSRWQCPERRRAVVERKENRGKARAIRDGFDRAAELGFTHVLTIDTDGQHDVADIPALLQQSLLHPGAIILGSRAQPEFSGCPLRSLWGRRISNFLVEAVSGLRVSDSQCGLRVYPLEQIRGIGARSGHYAFETEVLTLAAFHHIPVIEVPVRCIYPPPPARVTHFRPWRDSLRAAGMHARLLARSLWPVSFPDAHRADEDCRLGTIWNRCLRWASPMRSWKKMRHDMIERDRLASSLGWGAFMALQPYFGLKTVICLAISRLFKLQPVVVLAVSSLTTPPVGVLAWTLSILVGDLLIHGRAMGQIVPSTHRGAMAALRALSLEWIVGAVALGTLLGLTSALTARFVLRRIPIRN